MSAMTQTPSVSADFLTGKQHCERAATFNKDDFCSSRNNPNVKTNNKLDLKIQTRLKVYYGRSRNGLSMASCSTFILKTVHKNQLDICYFQTACFGLNRQKTNYNKYCLSVEVSVLITDKWGEFYLSLLFALVSQILSSGCTE